MKLTGNTILITGGGTGIGLAMAQEFLKRSNTVLICGRRESKLAEAAALNPGLLHQVADLSDPASRNALAGWAIGHGVNILINNAGMQREIDLRQGVAALESGDNECRVNFEGTIYFSALLIPFLMKQANAAIVNVSSGLGFVPLAITPIYSATKAGLHSYTISLRHQLEPSGVNVFEVIPPTVDTELDRGAREKRGQKDRGISASEVATALVEGMSVDKKEIAIGMAANLVGATREKLDEIFTRMNARR